MSSIHRNWYALPWSRLEDVSRDKHFDPENPDIVQVGWPGAEITDRQRGVTYRVTVQLSEGLVWLRTLEVDTHDGRPVTAEVLRRVPVRTLAEYAAKYLSERAAIRAAARTPGQPRPSTSLILPGIAGPGKIRLDGEVPTSEEIASLRQKGLRRTAIAEKYGRSPNTVSDWIARAYREVPELMPPRERGRKPKTSDGTPPSAKDTPSTEPGPNRSETP